VPYSGSLKSHLTAPLALFADPARAFALVSVLFYVGYVAGLHRLALLVAGPRAALLAALYAAFSPAFVTRYSLSNDGNYVEVLALGTWALWLAARWTREEAARYRLALAAGLLLGLAFWCHILAVIPALAVAFLFVLVARLRAVPSLVRLGLGWVVGYAPGIIWNRANDWLSFLYLIPGEARAGETGVRGLAAVTGGLGTKLSLMVTNHWPVLMGYDPGYRPVVDRLLFGLAWLGVTAAVVGGGHAAWRAARDRSWPLSALLLFAAVNLGVALLGLPHVPGNPRYILFLMSVVPVFLAATFGEGKRRLVLLVLIVTGAAASFAHVPDTLRSDARWREFVAALEGEGVRFCFTDFYLATKINFLSGERVVCSAKLGPTTTEYFFAYREAVDRAKEVAIVAVNRTSVTRMERRLEKLGVSYERRDLMKPVLLHLSRKVDPSELFPGRDFSMR
jgi:4-amino-4-deoxy-L-arabinose transferase-like glycosyltransferase